MIPNNSSGRDRYPFELVLDRYVCYPMETVTLTVLVQLVAPTRPILCIHIPQKTEVEEIHMDGVDDNDLVVYSKNFDGRFYAIQLNNYLQTGQTTQIRFVVRLNSLKINHYLSFCAWLSGDIPVIDSDWFTEPRSSRSIDLAVKANAEYLRFLPELYSYDDFINRFLMLFESFWKPINQQISMGDCYYDPNLTPDSFLKWLASWVGMRIDDTFPEERIRDLIKNAIPFSRSRGTSDSLRFFLEMYSGGRVEVSERKAHNMVLGGMVGLGDGLAFGMDNKPNTVLVKMVVPSSELERTGFSKEKYAKKIKSFIREIVPAHTIFTLSCKFE